MPILTDEEWDAISNPHWVRKRKQAKKNAMRFVGHRKDVSRHRNKENHWWAVYDKYVALCDNLKF